MAESPIYRIHIECPVCRTPNEFESIRVGAYTESGRDTDFRPLGRTWRHPDYQHLDPLYYSVATCSSCFYTHELDGHYKNWARDKRFTMYRLKALREAHLAALAQPDGAVRLLGSHLDMERHPRPSTISKLLLGVMDEQIAEGGDRLNVARYYLRMSWLFRDLGVQEPRAQDQARGVTEFHERLSALVRPLESSLSELRRLATDLRGVGRTSEFEAALDQLGQAALLVLTRGQGLRPALVGAPLAQAASPHAPAGEAFFEYPDYTAFLARLRAQGAELPLCEADAQGLAVDHYKHYFEQSKSFASPELEVQTAYLIAEIARRVGRARDASAYFNHAIRKGQELIHEYQNDPNRSGFLRKIVELAVEQGRKNRDEQEIEAEA